MKFQNTQNKDKILKNAIDKQQQKKPTKDIERDWHQNSNQQQWTSADIG